MRAIDYFDKGAEANLDRLAIVDGDSRMSYREAREITFKIARAMLANGFRGEQPAGIYSHNDARVLLSMLGIMRAGAVWVPINYRNAVDAVVEYMNYVEMAWLFYHSQFRDSVTEIKSRVPSLHHLVCLDRDDEPHPSLETFMQSGDGLEDLVDLRGGGRGLAGVPGLVQDVVVAGRHGWRNRDTAARDDRPCQRGSRHLAGVGHDDRDGNPLLARRM